MSPWTWVTLALTFLPIIVIVGILTLALYQRKQDRRRDPLTTDLQSLPGASLQRQITNLTDKFMEHYLGAVLLATAMAQVIVVRRVQIDLSSWDWLDWVLVGAIVAGAIYYGRRIVATARERRKLQDGLRGELATAQELGAVLAGTSQIIHDVQCDDFNIDHVVVAPSGIFAVETKSRRKPEAGGADAAKVKYDGKRLEFPGWVETEPLEQAERQARWLSRYLEKSTGESFPVRPVLALPGWYVVWHGDRSNSKVTVVNPKATAWLLTPANRPPVLDAKAIQKAAFAIQQRAATASREIA